VAIRSLVTVRIAAAIVLVAAACAGTPTPVPGTLQWERSDAVPASDAGPARVVALGGRFLGVGQGGAWTSGDGVSWNPLPLPLPGGLAGPAAPMVIASAGDIVVILGHVGEVPVSWTSTSGDAWQAAADPDLGPPPGFPQAVVSDVAVGPSGIVAAGDAWGGSEQRPVTWFSRDGLDWVRNDPLPGSGSRDLVATADGFVLAAADVARGGELTRAAFWTSPDGRTWTAAAEDASFGNAEPQRLAETTGGLVAVGYRVAAVGMAPMTWTSADGLAWEPASDSPALGWWAAPGPTPDTSSGALQGTMMNGVVALADGILAVGTRWGVDPHASPGPDGQRQMLFHGALWRSSDGRSWEVLPDESMALGTSSAGTLAFGLFMAIADGDTVLVYGAASDVGVTVWRGTPVP